MATLRSLTEHGGGRSGTLHYMAPSCFRGGASEASDLYALGVMATQVLTGRLPFDGERSEILVNRILNYEPELWDEGCRERCGASSNGCWRATRESVSTDAAQAGYELAVAAGLAPPQETVELRESYLQAASFVGRESELASLRTALSAAMRGQGAVADRRRERRRQVATVGRAAHAGPGARGARERGQAITEAHFGVSDLPRRAAQSVAVPCRCRRFEERTLLSVLPELPTLLGHEIAPPPELEPHAARARLQTVLSELPAAVDYAHRADLGGSALGRGRVASFCGASCRCCLSDRS